MTTTVDSQDLNGNDDSLPRLMAIVLFAAVTPALLLVAPVVVGQLINELGLSPEQAGYVISAELLGLSLATLPALFWMGRINWQHAAYMAVALTAAGNILSMFVSGFEALVILRLLTSMAAGSLMVLCMASIAMTRRQERNFGLWVIGQLVLGALGLMILPPMFAATGLWLFYLSLAVLIVALVPLVRYFPAHSRSAGDRGARVSMIEVTRGAPVAVLAIVGVLTFYVLISGVWTYVERIGNQSGLDAGAIGYILAAATVMGIVGAGLASVLAGRFSRAIMVTIGFGLLLLAVALLVGGPQMLRYAAAALIFKFTWTFVLPFMMATISSADPTGKLVVVTNLVIGTGLAIGPAVAAAMLGADIGYDGVLIALGIIGCASAAIMIYAAVRIPSVPSRTGS